MVHLQLLSPRTIRTPNGTIAQRATILHGIATYLIIERGKPVPRRRLLQLFWPNRPEHAARHPLRESLRKLRRKGILVTSDAHAEHVMIPKTSASIDVEELVHADFGDLILRDLAILPAYDPGISASHSDWIDDVRTHYHAVILRRLVEAVDYTKNIADWPMMHQLAERTLELDPGNPKALSAIGDARRLMRGLLSSPAHASPSHVRDTPTASLAPLGGHAAEQDTVLVGRTHDLTVLTNMLARAKRGHGSTLAITGPSGIGKSRLIRELAHIARYDTATVVRSTCHRASSTPLGVWYDLVPRLLRTPGASGCDPRTKSTLDEFTHASTDDEAVGVHNAPGNTPELQNAILDLAAAVTYEQPLVLIVEDVQWCDPDSISLFSTIAEQLSHEELLCTVTLRSGDDVNDNTAQLLPTFARHVLPPLPLAAITRHIEAYRGGVARRMPEELRAWCAQTADGNPYFAEELVNAWVTTPDAPITEAPPSSIQALVDIRLQHCDAIGIRILQACDTLGVYATVNRLSRLIGASEWRVAATTAELRTNGFLTVGGGTVTTGSQRIRCRHDLLAERAVALLTPSERRTLHEGAATILKRDLTAGDRALHLAYATHELAARDENRVGVKR